ncbi:uncharacterized protein LOC108907336 [Anoplophora glabripennis]|nr:uncharacterized protein LOC108907336 [Anoplophora glabripennis]
MLTNNFITSIFSSLVAKEINTLISCARKFKYGPGTQQNYKYSVDVKTFFNGTSKNESSLYVEGIVSLGFFTPCDGVLTLSDVKLSENTPSDPNNPNDQQFAYAVSEYSLRFSFKDGVINEICPSEEEKVWILNFKRGILSMLHNTMKRFDLDHSTEEEDVRGKCPTQYRILGADQTSLLIEKTKDLNSCQRRSKFHSVLQTRSTLNIESKTDKILNSSSHCLVSIDHNVYNDITCKETYVLQPFSNQGAGVSTTMVQKLSLLNEVTTNAYNSETEISLREALRFDHTVQPKITHAELKISRDLIKKLCKRSKNDDHTDLSDIFGKFIKSLRLLSYPALSALYGHSKATCPTGRKHLLDIMPFVNTAASVSVMRDIILHENVPEGTVNEWVLSIAFIANPNEDMMEVGMDLLHKHKFSPTIALSVASLTRSYCTQHSNCQNIDSVFSIVRYLELNFLKLLKMDYLERETYDEIMVTIKALSNIGVMSEDFQKELFKVIDNNNLDVGLRVAAVESFRRLPCEDSRNYFEYIFRNQDEDAEIRIASYLQIMRCPNYLLIRTIRHSLLHEEVNQVGSFIWTHLNNLLKTSVPSKVEIQSLLSEKDLVKKFSSDIRKFSNNFEGSLYFDDYNMGGSYESNIIFSTSSFIPKSAMFNFTVDVFGEAINLFEINGRLEGFEHYLESLFGPKGSSKSMAESIIDKVRGTRNARPDEVLKNQISRLPNVMDNVTKEPKVLLGLKVFGNELKYASFRGKKEIWDAVQDLDPVYHLKHIFSGKEISYNKAVMFLDCNYIVPTGAGLPLQLTALGTSSINLKLYGSLKTAGLSKDKDLEIDLTADIQPTVSLDVSGEMSVDAFYASTGAKLKANMYTDSAVRASVKVRGKKLVSVKFSLPRQKNEIFGVRSELLIKRNNKEERQRGISSNINLKSICSWPSVDKTIGLKLCAEYYYANVTGMDNVAHFLLAGPAGFRWYINKSDPTANVYLFEYKWTHQRDKSVISLIFDTPGSEINRVLNGNLTIDRQSQNLTMLLQSSVGTVLARGRYKNTENEKFIQVALDINDKKHFDASMSLVRSQIKNGFSYKPKVYVGVNGERVVKLDGSIDLMSKKSISQYTVDIKFETKRLNSKLFGYISKSESSLEVNLYQDYKFHHTKEQRITLKFGVANRSRNNMVVVLGFCNLNSSAYPNLNFASNATFQRSGSHMDLIIKLIQNPVADQPDADIQTLKFDLLFSYKSFTDNKRTLKLVTGLSRKSSNLALKGEFIYESFRHDVNIAALVKYGDNKEVAVTIFWSHPRLTLEQIKTHINITIPSFTPMILKLDVQEKHPKDFMIDIKATWFSGHSLNTIGFYQDKSTASSSNHHIKLFLNSPSFQDANVDVQYYRNNEVLKLDLKVSHNNDDYQILLHHQTMSPEETRTLAKVNIKDKLYRFFCTVYDENYKKIHAELRLDQIRDIDFTISVYNLETHKEFGFEINWDANRDPDQKLMVLAKYTKIADFNYVADFTLNYPSRTVRGEYKFVLQDRNLNTLASLSWDDGSTFAIDLNLRYGSEEKLFLEFSSNLRTPFENWKLMKLNGLFEHLNNKYIMNGMTAWDRGQRVAIDIFGDYTSTESIFTCKYSCSLASSLSHIPNINTTISHEQNETNFNSVLHLMYNPDFIIDLDSQWEIESNKDSTNLTGTVHSVTPFKGLNKGILVSKIFLKNTNDLKGIAELDLDNKKITVNLEGKFRKITNCMLIVNVTTPTEGYQLRFRISVEDRHFIALFSYPTGNLGAEVLFSVNSLANFNTKLYVATPVEFLQKVIIAAKLVPNQADFRLGWNFLLIGFSGVWNYVNITNFEYAYKIYTPLQDFEENGCVAKLVLSKEGLDSEASIKLSNYKLGVKLLGKSKPLKELGIEVRKVYLKSKASQMEKRNENPLSWNGLLELDVIIYPTIKGELEIDQKEYSYILQSTLTLPHGMATVYDEFEYIDIFSMRNSLKVDTPYQSMKTISSNFNFVVDTGRAYIFGLDVDYQNMTKLIKTGFHAKYLAETKETQNRVYNVTLNVNTPLQVFPKLNIFGGFMMDANNYHTLLTFETNRSDVHLDATTKINGGLLVLTSKFNMITPSIYIPPCQLNLTKLFSKSDNYVEINLNMPEKLPTDIHFRSSWLMKSRNEFRSKVQLMTPFTGLENTTTAVDVHVSKGKSTFIFALQMHPLDMEIHSTLQNNLFTSTSVLTFNRKRFPVFINCTISKPSEDIREFDGNLMLKDKLFDISGTADVIGGLPTRVAIRFTPIDKTPPLDFEYQLSAVGLNKYKIIGSVQHFNRFTNFNAYLSTTDKFNWEFNLQLDTSDSARITVHVKADSNTTSKNLIINARTPILRLEKPKLGATYTISGPEHVIHGFFEATKARGNIDVNFIWMFLENMYIKTVGRYESVNYIGESSLKAFYENPQKAFRSVKAGSDTKIGQIWEAGTNVSLHLEKPMEFEVHLKPPNDDNKEIHSVYGNLDYTKNYRNTDCLLKYRTRNSQRKYGIWGKILTENKSNLSGNIEVEWDSKRYNNYANFEGSGKVFDFIYKLKTPKFVDKQFLETNFKFASLSDHYNLTGQIFHPEKRSVAYATVDYKELGNMNGLINVTVPYKSLNYTGALFSAKTNDFQHNRHIKVFWQGNDAVLDSKCDIKSQGMSSERNLKGVLTVELPLATRHVAFMDYEYDKKPKNSMGHAVVKYNGTNVLDGTYKSVTESKVGINKDKIHVELQNKLVPVGADYIHTQESDSSKEDKANMPNVDNKYLHLYHLQNRSKFNVTGELYIRSTWSGQEYILKATHGNRTVKLWNGYDVLDREYRQHSRIELSPSNWIEYDIALINKTTDETFDVQQGIINVIYPRRKFTAQGFYNISNSIVSTDASLVWDKDNKTVKVGMDWRRSSVQREQLLLKIKHPSFERDVSLFSDYGYDKTSIDGQVFVDYSLDPDQRLTLRGKLSDNSNSRIYNYSYMAWAEHNTTNLILNSRGDFYWNSSTFGTEHVTNYRRSYLPLSTSVALARVNLQQNEIEMKKDSAATGLSYFYGKYGENFPIYTANIWAAHGVNDTAGEFYLNLKMKLLYLNVNLTEDGSQSLHMYGFIPDARSAVFDIWRDYEDKRVSDVSYFLRLNHSRLIMSRLQWRPELIGDVQSGIRRSIMKFYTDMLESINNTKQYARTETSDAIHGIWIDAKPNIHVFLSDLRNLSVIESDIDELKSFLNKSYHNNEFYIRDITTTVITMFDELALKSHLQSLPTIVQEIWSVMGESGQKIKRGILWVIEKVKLYYKNTTDFIHGFINGDPVEHISNLFEKLIEKYDNFIKNVHVTVIQYMEQMWSQISTLIVEHWHKTLAAIEPTFLKLIHYIESIVWNTGKEFLDFLYLRKNEIVESPYFVRFTKFSHDIDRFYKDITGKNTIGSIYKYITITWNFLKEKFINTIPFGKELSAIVSEIWTELKQIGNIPSIKYLITKWNESYECAKYYYDHFDVENRIHKIVTMIYIKLSDMSVTALEAENRQRVAKTKFVFEPDDGIMLLEQKLPMPWHAFNETPKFKEIPEIKAIYDLQKYLEASKISFWNLYYDYKPFVNPEEWLPPFKGQAMVVGTKYYVTFDRRYYEFQGRCTYLLATDFVDHNFTLLVDYDDVGNTNKLILLLNKSIIHIDMLNKRIQIGGVGMERLPLQIGDNYLYQDADILTVKGASGFNLECNMKFHICTFEMSGWYFGKTAGLWGTYNNEPSDDFTTSSKAHLNTSKLNAFGDSWTLDKNCKTSVPLNDNSKTAPQHILTLCEEFFTSKVSQLTSCFQKIPKESFISMCHNSQNEREACMSAISYINLCSYANIPLRIPDTCVKCNLLNNTEIKEGEFIRLQGSAVPQTADVVFIVEAKECNKDLIRSKNFDTVIEQLDKELSDLNVMNNRYSAVVFGGDGIFDEPRSVILNGKTFTDSKSIVNYFNNLPIGNGNKDMFNAIIFAYNLMFRPGVSRNFILLPCSECNKYNMDYDYSTIHQLLSEGAISLHIIMNDNFTMQKEREVRIPYGIDRRYAFTKRDMRSLVGDQLLRKSIILPKATLGHCLSLTMETNGTVFSGKYLEDKKNAKKCSTVFAKAVARKSLPRQCVDCECTAPNSGVSYMECYQCTMTNLTRNSIEQHILGFEDEDSFNTMNVFDGFSF